MEAMGFKIGTTEYTEYADRRGKEQAKKEK
jgi:hypothetical protein